MPEGWFLVSWFYWSLYLCIVWVLDKEREGVSSVTFLRLQIGRDKVHPAISLVGYEDELQPAMEYVFGSTFVCDTLQNAKKVCL